MANIQDGLEKLQPINASRTLQDQVYQSIRRLIIGGEFPPGTFIREQEICEQIEVSRTPVRESLGRLASEGFLERIPQRGYRVPEITIDQLLELYPIVSALESLAVKLSFSSITPAIIEELRQKNECFRKAVESGNVRKMVEYKSEFHFSLTRMCGNNRLIKLLGDLRSQLARLEYWYYSNTEYSLESLSEHDQLIRALEKGDPAKAQEIFETTRTSTFKAFLESKKREK